MTRLIAVVAVLALAACSPPGSGSLGPAPTGLPPTTPAVSPSATSISPSYDPSTASPGPSTLTIQLWFVRDGKLFQTRRTRPTTQATSRLALTELVAGPSTVEAAAGLTNQIAGNTSFDVKGIADGVATVAFTSGFFDGPMARLRQAQVVYTLTQFSTVTQVSFQPGNGPVGRADYADLLARIVVATPVIGQRISSPVTISGTSDTLEATVNVRVLDASGNEVATKFTTATCGNGCRGNYSMTVTYQVCQEQPGTIELYEVSSDDGSRISRVLIPVIFSACA